MRLPLLGTAALCLGFGLAAAQADTRTLRGGALNLTLTGDSDITIETDNSLSGEVRIVGDALDCLSVHDGGSVSTSACDSDLGHLAIMLPSGAPVGLEIAGSGNVSIGDLLGPLKAVISSDGDLKLRHASVLQLEIRGSGNATVQAVDGASDIAINGSGDVRITRLSGPLKARQNGSGDLGIGQIAAPAADIETRGSGDTLIAGGHVDFLRARTQGSGDIVMAGSVGAADLDAYGGGDIGLNHADGPVARHAGGGSSISVGSAHEIAASAMRKLRLQLAGKDDDDSDDDTDSGVHVTVHRSHNGFHDFLAGIVVLGLIYAGWRIIARNGGFTRRAPANAAPSDPGVLALCDLLAGLEKRLARVETHVTSREFELDRKFREMDAK